MGDHLKVSLWYIPPSEKQIHSEVVKEKKECFCFSSLPSKINRTRRSLCITKDRGKSLNFSSFSSKVRGAERAHLPPLPCSWNQQLVILANDISNSHTYYKTLTVPSRVWLHGLFDIWILPIREYVDIFNLLNAYPLRFKTGEFCFHMIDFGIPLLLLIFRSCFFPSPHAHHLH